jgi:D-alanyl-D-alanine carboxypeptidase
VLGGSSARDRNERAAELVLKGLSGSAAPTGQTILTLGNQVGAAPVDMRLSICGKGAAEFQKAQEAAFPMGLKGQPSYLNDVVAPRSYVATNLGRIAAGVNLPRPRPNNHIPMFPTPVADASVSGELRPGLTAVSGAVVPFPQPRPSL